MGIALITGINGFVGKHLGFLLKSHGYIVYGTSRKINLEEKVSYYDKQFQITFDSKEEIKNLLEKTKPKFVFHLLAQSNVRSSWNNPVETFYTNLFKTINLFEAVSELNFPVRIINIGSSEEYGFCKTWSMPITEDFPLYPQNSYGISKAASFMMINQYVKRFGLDIIHMRPFNHIGPGQKEGFFVPDMTSQLIQIEKGLKEPVIKVGNLNSKRDFTDVRDVVNGYLLAAEKGKTGEVYNVCSGRSIKVADVLEKLITTSGVRVDLEIDKSLFRPIDIPEYYGSNEKINRDVGWKPKRLLDETLNDVITFSRFSI